MFEENEAREQLRRTNKVICKNQLSDQLVGKH